MRLLKVFFALVIAALAVTAGIFVAAIGAVAVAAFFLIRGLSRRLVGDSSRPAPAVARPARPPVAPGSSDVIEVTATEVRSDPSLR